ncbi:MAG TPA: CdaR family protein [Thermoanaerobaculia bacterium]|nr:CdaR family protein [Thermoanaerobaculia bacterium]
MSDGARLWGLRLLALGIAIGLWFSISFEAREAPSERLVEASVSYNRPRGFVVLDPVGSVNIRLRGSSKAVRRLNPYEVSIQVNLTRAQEGTFTIPLGTENILLPENLEVVTIEPPSIQVELEREVTQRLPVVPKLVGEPAAGATLEEPEILPNQVLVTGPASRLRKLSGLSTREISLDGHAFPFEETVPVTSPDPLIQVVQPFKVTVRVILQPPRIEAPAASTKKKGKKTAPGR